MSCNVCHVDMPTLKPFLHKILMTLANMGYLYVCKMQYSISSAL